MNFKGRAKICLEGLKETTRTSVRTIGVPVEILPNTSQKRYSWVQVSLCCLVRLCFAGHLQTVSVQKKCAHERSNGRRRDVLCYVRTVVGHGDIGQPPLARSGVNGSAFLEKCY